MLRDHDVLATELKLDTAGADQNLVAACVHLDSSLLGTLPSLLNVDCCDGVLNLFAVDLLGCDSEIYNPPENHGPRTSELLLIRAEILTHASDCMRGDRERHEKTENCESPDQVQSPNILRFSGTNRALRPRI